MILKILWTIRYLAYSFFLGKSGFPSYIGKPVFINRFNRLFIGKKVRIFPNCRIEIQDNCACIIIEDDTSIAQNFHIISGCKQQLKIGKGTTISANVFITNIEHNYQQTGKHILKQPLLSQKTTIGENCFIGYGSVIQAGTVLGKQCIVGANAVVRGTFPDYSVIVGIPAKIVKRYNESSGKWEKTNAKGEFTNEV